MGNNVRISIVGFGGGGAMFHDFSNVDDLGSYIRSFVAEHGGAEEYTISLIITFHEQVSGADFCRVVARSIGTVVRLLGNGSVSGDVTVRSSGQSHPIATGQFVAERGRASISLNVATTMLTGKNGEDKFGVVLNPVVRVLGQKYVAVVSAEYSRIKIAFSTLGSSGITELETLCNTVFAGVVPMLMARYPMCLGNIGTFLRLLKSLGVVGDSTRVVLYVSSATDVTGIAGLVDAMSSALDRACGKLITILSIFIAYFMFRARTYRDVYSITVRVDPDGHYLLELLPGPFLGKAIEGNEKDMPIVYAVAKLLAGLGMSAVESVTPHS